MNYLKKYRKEAGLANTDENKNGECDANNPYNDNTPTKETLAYLNGMLKHKSTPMTTQFQHQNTASNSNLMKTPVRRGSPAKKQTHSAMRLSQQRVSAIKPFGKVDTNLQQNSSRRSIQMSGQSKKGQEPARSSRNFTGQTSSPFTVAEKSTSNLINQKLQSHTSSKRLPTKSALPSAGSKLRTSTTGKKTPGLPSSIFTSSVRQSQNQQPPLHQANNATPSNGNKNSIFRQEVTPQRVNTNTGSKHTATKTPNEERYNSSTSKQFQSKRKSTNQQSVQRNRTAKRRHGSQVSDTASEKAVKDAMMKTTQKIFFPKAFALPGSKQAKRDKLQLQQQLKDQEDQEAEEAEAEHQMVEMAATAKRAVANFNTNESDDQEIIQAQQYAAVRKSLHQNQTFNEQDSCPMISYAHPADDRHIVDERSFTSIENMIENQTDFGEVSKLSGGGTRRSRKDRSKNKTGRNAITPHIISGMKMLGDVGVSPNVRMIPGSDTISLELNVKGMTEPNKNFQDGPNTTASQTEDSQTQATSYRHQQEPRKRNSFIGNLQRATQQKAELVPHSRNTGTSSYYNAYQQTQQPQSNNLKGALNAYVAVTGARSRTPLINENSYSAAAYEAGPQRLADKIMKPVLVSGASLHKKTISNAVQNSVANTITPQKSQANRPIDRHQSAMRLQHQQRSSVQYDQTLRQQRSFVGATKTTQGSMTPLRHGEDHTPTRLALDRSRYSNVTTPIDRASESLEKINGVFRSLSVGTFDAISLIKKPAKSDIDGCYIFCRFVNAFRPEAEQWDSFSLQTWQSMQSFMLYSPNCQKICLEVQQIKKKVLRPHICRVQNHTYDQLADLRATFMGNLNERNLNVQFKHSQVVRKLVMLVLVSVMHLLPEEQCQQPDEMLPESSDKQDALCQSPENHSETAEEIIDLVTNHGPDFTPQQQVEADSDSDSNNDSNQDEAEVTASISQRDEMVQRQDDHNDLQQDNFVGASYAENNEQQINTDQNQYHNGPLVEVKTQVQQQALTNNRYSQQHLLDDESCAEEQDNEHDIPYQAAEADEVDSYKGSAWPSETSRLTPHQSNYLQQIQLTPNQHHQNIQKPIPQQKATKKVIVKKEEPMTEMKRVPYRIMDRAEGGDMFEEFSCSSGFERVVQQQQQQQQQSDVANQQEIGAGLFKRTNQVTSIACQQQMDEASAMQAVSDLASNQAISKEERIAQLQAAQEMIQRQIADLLQAENQVKMNMQEESKSLAEVGIGALALTEKIDADESQDWVQASPIRLSRFVCESPQKLSAIKASLAIKQETVEKEIDSILGESPSPSKQVQRVDWTLISPQKFSLKLDRVPDQVVEVNAENNSSDQDISSHNLTAEEEEKDRQNLLRTYQEKDAQQAILSQRDRENALSQMDLASSDGEKPCSEIRMSFFSPTKLSECFVNRGQTEGSLRFHDAIQKHEQDLQSQQGFNIRAQMDEKLQQRLQKREDDGPADSPNTRDKKYRQMQNDIFSKIQAQLNM